MTKFGEILRARRLALGHSLRRFCGEHGLDPSNWSKLERGRVAPPQGDLLRRYAEILGLEHGSDEWHQFFDVAHAEAGRIPEDLRDEEIAAKLPALFRTLRESANHGGEDDEELLRELRKKIREA